MPAFFEAFPDADGAIEELVAAGDVVVARWRTAATHRAEFAGAPASGKRVEWGGINWYRLEGGRIVAMWQSADTLALLQQIGAAILTSNQPRRRPAHSPAIRFDVKFDPRKGANGSSG